MKIQIMGGKGVMAKHCLAFSLTTPSNVLPLHLKQIFQPIIWIFTEGEGDGIESRLPFKKISTLTKYHWISKLQLQKQHVFRISLQYTQTRPLNNASQQVFSADQQCFQRQFEFRSSRFRFRWEPRWPPTATPTWCLVAGSLTKKRQWW